MKQIHEENKKANHLQDKIMIKLEQSVLCMSDFKNFPTVTSGNNGIQFDHYSNHKSIQNVNDARMQYYAQRLAQAEERIFSHVDLYERAKL